jgi:uncharacterized protein (TIGR02246 family)
MANESGDKDAIRELLARYCFHLDNDRFEEMAALFTEDGTWDTAFGKGTGRAGIAAQARSIAASGAPRPRRVHLTTNIVIDLNGDTATVQSNWAVVQNSDQGPGIGSAGAYADQLVKRGGRWFFRYRKIDRFIADGLR